MATIPSGSRASGVEPFDLAFDSAAVTGLYERNAGRLFGYCLSRLGRREDAEDAVQTTFVHAIRGLRRGVVPLIESAWLLGIARNVCLTRREAFGRRKRLEAVCDPHDLESASAAPQASPEELLGLDAALAALPERQRRAVLLRDWRGLSYDEIATELEVSRAAVETLIFRGRQTLAELLSEEPRTTRKRLGSLGNLGSIFAALKAAFSGGALAVKVAAAVVAVSSAGLAVGSGDGSSASVPRVGDAPRVTEPPSRMAASTPTASRLPAPTASPAGSKSKVAGLARAPRAGAKSKTHAHAKAAPAVTAAPSGSTSAEEPTAAPAAPATAAVAPADAAAAAAAPAPVVKGIAAKVAKAVKEPASVLPVTTPPIPAPPVATPPVPQDAAASLPAPPLPTPPLPAPPVPVPSVPAPPVATPSPAVPPVPPVSPPPAPPVPPLP